MRVVIASDGSGFRLTMKPNHSWGNRSALERNADSPRKCQIRKVSPTAATRLEDEPRRSSRSKTYVTPVAVDPIRLSGGVG